MGRSEVPQKSGGALGRMGKAILQALGLFVILEPIWMLLPFAGFLYGSVMQMDRLARNPSTAWLTHFVFPVLTLGWLGPALVAAGFAVFLVGACQIYRAKIRRSGLVTGGLYRFVRHPQYIALTLFGLGILLTWGRAITFLAFFGMMFLYYYLAKSEERNCLALFGKEYERYRERTSFIVPGDRHLRRLRAKRSGFHLPGPIRVAGAFVLMMAVCLALMKLIDVVKMAVRSVPYLTATIRFEPTAAGAPEPRETVVSTTSGGIPFAQAGRLAVVRGPYRNAQAAGFAERLIARLREAGALKEFLAFLDEPGGDAAIAFCAPYEGQEATPEPTQDERRGPPPDTAGADRVRLIVMRCGLAQGASIGDALADKSKRQIRDACIAQVNLGRPKGEGITEGDLIRPGRGFPAEERWDFLLRQFSAAGSSSPRDTASLAPSDATSARLALVCAPILRTRLDSAFAKEILDRLVESSRFRDHLRTSGVGGPVVAVAFPTPGANWYREHHGKPQISICVMMVRLGEGPEMDDLFHPGRRGPLLGAFFSDMDFRIEPPKDSVLEVRPVGPRRDLEERWQFFLSGVGGSSVRYH